MDDIGAISETAGAAALEIAVSAVRERGGKLGPCPNCTTPMIGPYCAACGQPIETHRRSVFRLLHDFIADIASFDSRIMRTVYALMLRPGELSLAFREGRTQRYVPAVRLYLFVSLIFFVVLSTAGIAILQLELISTTDVYKVDAKGQVIDVKNGVPQVLKDFGVDAKGNLYVTKHGVRVVLKGLKANGKLNHNVTTRPHFFAPVGAAKAASPQIVAELDRSWKEDAAEARQDKEGWGLWIVNHVQQTMHALATNPAAVNEPLTQWIPRALFVLLPIFALVLALFYWRKRRQYFYVDHLVFSLNFHSFVFAIILIAVGAARILPGSWVGIGAVAGMGLYLLIAMKRFYGQGWFWTGVKFVSVTLVYFFFLFPTLAGIFLAALMGV